MDNDNKVESEHTATSTSEKISAMARKNNTPYDDVFRTLLNDCKQLLLPVLNEVFDEKYTGNETIVYSINEHFLNMQDGMEDKRVTDSAFTVIGEEAKNYLFECQSTPDSSMLVRIFEYETQVALDEGKIVGNTLEVTFPNAAILYLRSNNSTPDDMTIKMNTPGGSVSFDVLVMKVKNYGIKEIFEKDLLFLIPFYIFNYGSRKQLEELEDNSEKLAALEHEYEAIVERLNELTEQKKLSAYYRMTILEMSNKVVENLAARYKKIVKGVKEIMGGTILNYKAKDILREGAMEEKKETVLTMHEDGVADDVIAKYTRISVETVRQWIHMEEFTPHSRVMV